MKLSTCCDAPVQGEDPICSKCKEHCGVYEEEKPTIEQVAWVFDKIATHMKEGGTFRYLIYDRMGFSGDAYTPLYSSGGMSITNMIHDYLEEK